MNSSWFALNSDKNRNDVSITGEIKHCKFAILMNTVAHEWVGIVDNRDRATDIGVGRI